MIFHCDCNRNRSKFFKSRFTKGSINKMGKIRSKSTMQFLKESLERNARWVTERKLAISDNNELAQVILEDNKKREEKIKNNEEIIKQQEKQIQIQEEKFAKQLFNYNKFSGRNLV